MNASLSERGAVLGTSVSDFFYSEEKMYDYSKPAFQFKSAHFTAVRAMIIDQYLLNTLCFKKIKNCFFHSYVLKNLFSDGLEVNSGDGLFLCYQ